MSKKIVVWDLFGGGNNSIYKSLDKEKYNIYIYFWYNTTNKRESLWFRFIIRFNSFYSLY